MGTICTKSEEFEAVSLYGVWILDSKRALIFYDQWSRITNINEIGKRKGKKVGKTLGGIDGIMADTTEV